MVLPPGMKIHTEATVDRTFRSFSFKMWYAEQKRHILYSLLRHPWFYNLYKYTHSDPYYYSLPLSSSTQKGRSQPDIPSYFLDASPPTNSSIVDANHDLQLEYINSNDASPQTVDYSYTEDTRYVQSYVDLLGEWIQDSDDDIAVYTSFLSRLLQVSSLKALNNLLLHPPSLAYFIHNYQLTVLSLCENNNVHISFPYRRELSKLVYLISRCNKDNNNDCIY